MSKSTTGGRHDGVEAGKKRQEKGRNQGKGERGGRNSGKMMTQHRNGGYREAEGVETEYETGKKAVLSRQPVLLFSEKLHV
jgi:hypothetical protein